MKKVSSSKRFFKLRPELLLRGWADVRYGLLDARNGKLIVLTKAAVDALELAWNAIAVDSPAMLAAHRRAIDALVKYGCGILTHEFAAPEPVQRFKAAPCCYTASIHWSVTGRCNMRCRHCYVDAPQAHYGEMTLHECVGIMDQMLEANISSVSLTGGEPLIRAGWRTFYRELKQRGVGVSAIYTNGLVLTDKWLDGFAELEERKIAFSLSFDGIGHHDWLRGRQGVEELTIEAIKRLVARGYPVEIETALYKENAAVMRQTCALLADLGISGWKLSKIVNSAAWQPYAAEHGISREELNRCYLDLLEEFERRGRPFSLQLDHRYLYRAGSRSVAYPAHHGDGTPQSLKRSVCSCMREHPYLLPDGTLMPCMPLANCGLDREMPNLRQVPLVEILKPHSKFLDFISVTPEEMFAREPSACARCQHRFECCGGCRARAYAAGNLYGPDPEMCEYFKTEERFLYEPHDGRPK